MKQYPRIYSLSTVGLIHHQEFDYRFHPFRTDFIGESGAGKSIIADLIQLIFVGSEAFESATRGTDIRDPEGMVLKTERRGKGIGYAFLNIEMAPGQYLVVGSYMETGNRNTQAFIVQAGYDWQHIQYMSAPLSFKQILKEEEIPPIDLLKEWLDEQKMHCKAWQRYKEFHKILFREKIVPLDLASSERLLNDYAGILQSFSRGKMLNTQNSDSLKQFLFDNQEANRILENYKNAAKDMESAIGEYGSNLREIERVTQKQKALLQLKELKDQRDEWQEKWLHKSVLFWSQESRIFEKDMKDCIVNYAKAAQHHYILKELLEDEINGLRNKLPDLEQALKDAEEEYDKISPQNTLLSQVLDWLREFNCSYEELIHKYREYKDNRSAKVALEPFIKALRSKNVEKVFEASPNKETPASLNQYLTSIITETGDLIQQKNRLKKYASINDPESLANWAIQQKRAFSVEEESAILHFQDLPRKKPDDFRNYLPRPAELILALSIAEKEGDGFWINLNGIRNYIPLISEQILDTTDERKIHSYFEQYTATIEKDIRELEKQQMAYKTLQEILNTLDNPVQALSAYQKSETLLQHRDIPSLNISEERFMEYRDLYQQKEHIQEKFTQARNKKGSINAKATSIRITLQDCQLISKTFASISIPGNDIQTIIDEYLKAEDLKDVSVFEKQNISGSLSREDNKGNFFKEQWEIIHPSLSNIQQLSSLKSSLDNAYAELGKAKERYLKWYERLPEIQEPSEYILEPKQEYQKYFEAETMYTTKYSGIIEQYIASEAYRLNEVKDFMELSKNLLPEAFYDAVIDQSEASVIDTIANYLIRINERNKQLNNRKIQKIKNLLDEVDEIITQQENTIRRIDNFLKAGNQITGGYTARLRKELAANYPKTWMSTFKEMVEDEHHFADLQNKLGEKVDLAEMMKAAFQNCSGSPLANVSVSKLLDPSNYYELSFAMESESGRINKGSTGQTYAAIALLCVARLSIMGSEEGKSMEPAVRVMPIDEAEGLGSNYDMLHDIALKYDYQLISFSIGPIAKFKDGEQYLYMLHKNMEEEAPVNHTPLAILCESDRTTNTSEV